MKNKEICIKKIPLDRFIDVLMNLYNKGLDYIDIQGIPGDVEDKLAISFTNDYMIGEDNDKETVAEFDANAENKVRHIKELDMKLTYEELNQLL